MLTKNKQPKKYCEIRTAKKKHATEIQKILAKYAKENLLLPRPIEDIEKNISSFKVALKDGKVIGSCAVKNYGNGLFEIRSLAVLKQYNGRGIGTLLVARWLATLKRKQQAKKIFALTYRPALFERIGFKIVSKDMFPEKIWSDCSLCAKKEKCDEIAVLMQL